MVRKTYKVHDIVIPQANDPTKTVSKTVYESETHHAEDGMIGFEAPDATLVSNVLTPVDSLVVVRGEGAAADVIDHITFGSTPDIKDKDLLWLAKGAEDITINHNTSTPPSDSGPVLLLSKANKKMQGSRVVLLQRQGNNFQEIAFDGTVGDGGVIVEDDSGNALIVAGSVASAVNHLKVTNAAAGNDVIIESIGTDTNIGIKFVKKGTGKFTMAGNVIHEGRNQEDKGSDVASAGIVTLGGDGNFFDITGTTTINEILGTNWQAGSQIVLQFDGILTITNNSGGTNDILTGDGSNITTAAGFVLGLKFNGTDWIEIFRNTVVGTTVLWTVLGDYEATIAEGSHNFNFTGVDFDDDSYLVLVIDGSVTASLALQLRINTLATGTYFGDGANIIAGTETLSDQNSQTFVEISPSTLHSGANEVFFGKIEIGLQKSGPNDRPLFLSNIRGDRGISTISGMNTTVTSSITDVEIRTSTSTWQIGTRATLYKVARV